MMSVEFEADKNELTFDQLMGEMKWLSQSLLLAG
jgi:hypothetical protein